MKNSDLTSSSRRHFLTAAPAVAATGLALSGTLFAAKASAEDLAAGKGEAFQHFSAETLARSVQAMQGKSANDNLVTDKHVLTILGVETAKSAKEFEWHEGRDHVFVILEGETVYELGGTPQGAHKIREGEWLAPGAENAQKLTLKKGDVLAVPRGVLHRRSTAGSVTFLLVTSVS